MTLTEYIEQLQAIKDEHGGDMQVMGTTFKKGQPRVRYLYNKYRVCESPLNGFWGEDFDPLSTRGEKVVLIP